MFLPVQPDGLISCRGMSDSFDRIAQAKDKEEWKDRKRKKRQGEVRGLSELCQSAETEG